MVTPAPPEEQPEEAASRPEREEGQGEEERAGRAALGMYLFFVFCTLHISLAFPNPCVAAGDAGRGWGIGKFVK